jgi:trk system potassium uptake protein TrkH
MRDFRSVIHIIGLLLCIEAVAMMIPMVVDLMYGNSDWNGFFLSGLITFFIGVFQFLSLLEK